MPVENPISDLIQQIEGTRAGVVGAMDLTQVDRTLISSILMKHPVKSNVGKLINASAFIKTASDRGTTIYFLLKRDLPQNKKVIIMSATPQVHLYKKLYPGKVEVIDISNIELTGKVYQHTDRSYSRATLDGTLILKILDEIGYVPAIVHKNMKEFFFHYESPMHFGNVLGYNEYNGWDIAVIGTPHQNEIVYRLMAHAVGVDPNLEKEIMMRQVEYGNFRFSFRTFANKEMQEIQLGLIESELLQAVGRARTLRNDCVVELYSNLPLSCSTFAQAA